jgi:hypothetical protein
MIVMAFSGPNGAGFDQSSVSLNVTGSTISLPSITPTNPNALLVSYVLAHQTAVTSIDGIDSGFSMTSTSTPIPFWGSAAYKEQIEVSAIAPTWTITPTGTGDVSALLLSFIPPPLP